ncbi:hypothetical protein [Mesoplasma photuris]|uniref:hypothetical protein n=1 Tax=Mesoplasma photuris TaxID=217731 RepID=UPI000AD8DDED|nr:hypothetical protein [Mesoplasma photuris]
MKKFNLKEFNFKIFFQSLKSNLPLIILALADVVIMAIPFYMENYIPNIYKNLGLDASEYSQAGAIYGFVSLPCYFLGSYIGDKFKSKNLIIISIFLSTLLGIWYISLPISAAYSGESQYTAIQLYIIFAGFAFATCALFWGPLWKTVKNHGTEKLEGDHKEKKVGRNNGYQGMFNGLIGLTLALFGTLLMQLGAGYVGAIPDISINGQSVNTGFFILVVTYVALTAVSGILAIFYIKSEDDRPSEVSFSVKNIIQVLGNVHIWLLSFLVLGVYMLQMGLGSYVNYMSNIFLIPAVVVMIIGIFRTYVMRFLISGWFGKAADKSHSYILWICIGLFIGLLFILLGVLLPGFNNDFDPTKNKTAGTIIQVVACLNLVLLGGVTWALVTIRWSPLGAELNVQNQNYAAAINVVSVIAFTPDAFFKQIKAAIESKYWMYLKDENGVLTDTKVASQQGNQIILGVVIGFALFGVISGIILYILLYRKSDKFIFRKKQKFVQNI